MESAFHTGRLRFPVPVVFSVCCWFADIFSFLRAAAAAAAFSLICAARFFFFPATAVLPVLVNKDKEDIFGVVAAFEFARGLLF